MVHVPELVRKPSDTSTRIYTENRYRTEKRTILDLDIACIQ